MCYFDFSLPVVEGQNGEPDGPAEPGDRVVYKTSQVEVLSLRPDVQFSERLSD